jgi:hypothetical protein
MPLIAREIDTHRVEIDGDWYDLRKALGHFHRTMVSQVGAVTLHLRGRDVRDASKDFIIADNDTVAATLENTAENNNLRLYAYIRAWSHPEPVSKDNCKRIPPAHAAALLREITQLQRHQDGPKDSDPLASNSTSSSDE